MHKHISFLSAIAFAIADETGHDLPEAKQPVPEAATVAAIVNVETENRKAKQAAQRAKREAATGDKPSKAKPTSAKPNGKRSKPVSAASTTEAKPDPRVARAERIAADRTAVSALYAAFEANRASVPVKPLSAFKPVATTAHPIARNPSTRQAAAIAIAFAAAGKQLKPGTSVARVFEYDGRRCAIENGVLRDAVSSGLVSVAGDTPETERITLAAKADRAIIGLIGERAAKAGKLIPA